MQQASLVLSSQDGKTARYQMHLDIFFPQKHRCVMLPLPLNPSKFHAQQNKLCLLPPQALVRTADR